MNTNERTADNGEIIISNDVIASIALNAAKDVEGVTGFVSKNSAGRGGKASGGDPGTKAVRVLVLDNDVRIQIFIRVKSGSNIQEVSTAIQRSVKGAVQSMTGKVVSKVNVSIQGIDFDIPQAPEDKKIKP